MMTFIMAELDCDEKENYKCSNMRVIQGGLILAQVTNRKNKRSQITHFPNHENKQARYSFK